MFISKKSIFSLLSMMGLIANISNKAMTLHDNGEVNITRAVKCYAVTAEQQKGYVANRVFSGSLTHRQTIKMPAADILVVEGPFSYSSPLTFTEINGIQQIAFRVTSCTRLGFIKPAHLVDLTHCTNLRTSEGHTILQILAENYIDGNCDIPSLALKQATLEHIYKKRESPVPARAEGEIPSSAASYCIVS